MTETDTKFFFEFIPVPTAVPPCARNKISFKANSLQIPWVPCRLYGVEGGNRRKFPGQGSKSDSFRPLVPAQGSKSDGFRPFSAPFPSTRPGSPCGRKWAENLFKSNGFRSFSAPFRAFRNRSLRFDTLSMRPCQ